MAAQRVLSGLAGTAAALTLAVQPAAALDETPFLSSTGGRGFLADTEKSLYEVRKQKEGEAMMELEKERELLETEARKDLLSSNKLCATPLGVDVVGISESIALIGALVGGLSAKARKEEVERLNEQLRSINLSLRQQARSGTLYAPGLTYMPPPTVQQKSPEQKRADLEKVMSTPTLRPLSSIDESELTPQQMQLRASLKEGRKMLKDGDGAASMVRFEKALMLARAQKDLVQERRACRGMAAACRMTKQLQQSVDYLFKVLELSDRMDEYTGDSDAYGTIADVYTEMGEFEKAAVYYDKYIERMDADATVV